MNVYVVLKVDQDLKDWTGDDSIDSIFCGVRSSFSAAQALALELRRADSKFLYVIRTIKIK